MRFLVFFLATIVGLPLYANVVKVGIYGEIIDQDYEYAHNAVADTVVIYAQKDDTTQERIARKGFLVRYKKAKGTVLISHGFMCDKYMAGLLRFVFYPDFNVMTFDFRAHGESTQGQQCTFGRDEAHDVIAAAHFLKNHPDLKGKPLFFYGFSMGAVAGIQGAAVQKGLFRAFVFDCPFASTDTVVQAGLERMKGSFLGYEFDIPGRYIFEKCAYHPYVQSFLKICLKLIDTLGVYNVPTNILPFSPAESIKKIDGPCFFIHCKQDKTVPTESIRCLYQACGSQHKKLWLTDGRGHFDSFFYNPERYSKKIREFLAAVLKGKLQGISVVDDDGTRRAPRKVG